MEPPPLADEPISHHDLPGDGEIGDLGAQDPGRIGDRNIPFARSRKIDAVEPDAETGNDFELGQQPDERPIGAPILGPSFASHVWFDAACHVAHIRPRVLLESAAPQTLIALARTGYGIAVVPSPVRIPRDGVRIVPLVHRGVPIGRLLVVAWDPRRLLAQYGEQFVTELAAHVRRSHPGSDLMRRAPPMPRPKEPIG